MKQVFSALIIGAAFAAAQAHAACDYPIAPGKFPDGSQATKEEMLAAKGLVVKYNTDMDSVPRLHQGRIRRQGRPA